jgi:uncharacterized protein DUF6703
MTAEFAHGDGRASVAGGKDTDVTTPGRRSHRGRLEQASAAPLVYLRQFPRWMLPLVTAALLVAGLAAHGWPAVAALAVLAVCLGWLAALSWPGLHGPGRLLRVAVVACVLALAVAQALR